MPLRIPFSLPTRKQLLTAFDKFWRSILAFLVQLLRWARVTFRFWRRAWDPPVFGLFVTVVILIVGALTVARLMHRFLPKVEMVVSPFEVPAGGGAQVPWTGKTVANLFIDELQQIIREASKFHGERFASKRQYHQVPDLPKIPIEKSSDLQFEGLSLKQMLSVWDSYRYDEQSLSGDVIVNQDGTLSLRARVAADEQALFWQVDKIDGGQNIPRTTDGLKKGLRSLAIEVFKSLNPETVGRYFLAVALTSPRNDQDGHFQQAQDVFEAWIAREPKRPEPFFYLSYVYGHLDRLEEAQQAARQALDNAPSYYLATGMIAWALAQKALNARTSDREKTLKKAIEEHEHALNDSRIWWRWWANPAPNYWSNLCFEYSQLNLFDKAKRACKKAARIDKAFPTPLDLLGHLYESRAKAEADKNPKQAKSDLNQAEGAYREALKRQPDFFVGLYDLTTLLIDPSLNRREEAIKECEKAVAAFPKASEPLVALGQIYELEARRNSKDNQYSSRMNLAVDQYLRATRTDEKSPDAWVALGSLQFSRGQFNEAFHDFQHAYELSRNPDFLADAGEALAEQGRSGEGLKDLEKALNKRPALADNKWFELHLGDAYLGERRFQKAQEAYLRAEAISEEEHRRDSAVLSFRDMDFYWQRARNLIPDLLNR